jgi:pyruvate carboxylase subunit B
MKYTVTVGAREVQVVLDGDRILVDGAAHHAHLSALTGTPLWLLILDGVPVTLPAERSGRGAWVVTSQGERLEVRAEDERARHIRSLLGTQATHQAAGLVRAPMPGLVVRILVSEGDAVAAGQGLLVLEAMKMENEIRAPAAGTVGRLGVLPGQAVEKGQLLFELVPA